MRFGRQLRALLWERDISVSAFAHRTGVTPGYLSKLILLEGRDPSSAVLCRILHGFELFERALTPDEIAGLTRARYDDWLASRQDRSPNPFHPGVPLTNTARREGMGDVICNGSTR